MAGGVREPGERGAQALVAAPAEAGGLALAGLDRDRGLAGVAGERVAGGVTATAVADLGEHLGGGEEAVRIFEQRQEDLTIGMRAHRVLDLSLERLDLRAERPERLNQTEHDLPARAFSSTSPTRPSGARRSFANSRSGF